MLQTGKKSCARVDIKEDDLTFNCEWSDCQQHFKDMKQFQMHINCHIHDFLILETQKDNCFDCKWRECGSQIIGNVHDFNRHVYFHSFHVKLKCLGDILVARTDYPKCGLGGQSRNWIPELPESLQCGWSSCGVVCDNPVLFYSHVAHHCEEYNGGNRLKDACACRWAECDSLFKSKYKLREHLRSHTQEKVVACPTCGGLFANRTKLFDHLTRQRESSVYCYQCSHCNKRFATERLLRDHMRHHVNHYKCPFCDMTVPTPSSLRTHIKFRHTQEKPYKCPLCEHSSKSSSDLRRHVDCHNSEIQYRCCIDDCIYATRYYTCLASHYKRIHNINNIKRYVCHLCDSKFTRGSELTKHLKTKHKFKWPPGHIRFRYKSHEDGTLRLQTVRYESIEVTEQSFEGDNEEAVRIDDTSAPVVMGNEENTDPTPGQSAPSIVSGQDHGSLLNTLSSNAQAIGQTLCDNPSTARKPLDQGLLSHSVSSLSSMSSSTNQSSLLPSSSTFVGLLSCDSDTSNSMMLPVVYPPKDRQLTYQGETELSTISSLQLDCENKSLGFSDHQQSMELGDEAQPVVSSDGRDHCRGDIKFQLITSQGEKNNLAVDSDGMLIFTTITDKPSDAVGFPGVMSTPNKPIQTMSGILAEDDASYNLALLGDVALSEPIVAGNRGFSKPGTSDMAYY